MQKKIIVLGSSGMAGHVLTLMLRVSPEKYKVIAVSRTKDITHPDVLADVSDFDTLKKLIDGVAPDYIVNCIGLLNKTAEDYPDQAILINSYLPHFLETLTKGTSTCIIHISTDCVFSGAKGGYTENELKDGKGFYAQSKALGEIINDKDLTIRTSIIGPEIKQNGIGLLHWFLAQQGEIKGYTGAIWSGVTTIQLAKTILHLFDNQMPVGLVHLTNNQPINKFDLLTLFKLVFVRSQVQLVPYIDYKVDKSLINTNSMFDPKVPSYMQMLEEMKAWIETHPDLYIYSI